MTPTRSVHSSSSSAPMAELRRSCNFCRQRRMKCNGELPWCVACFERNSPCVYESVGARGRPKRKDSDQILNSPLQIASNRPGTAQTTLKQSYFSQNDHNPASTIAGELIALDRVIWSSVQSDNSVRYCLSLDGVEPIPSLLTVLEQLVYLTTGSVNGTQYIDLSSQSDDGGIGTPGRTLSQDNGQPVLSASQLLQLIELAFIWHPFLSLIVSKTSLLYDHRDGVAHAALLLTVAAEGLGLGMPCSEPIFHAGALPSVEVLLDRGENELYRSASASSNPQYAMSICHTLLLLSYRMLVTSRIRRAAVYLSLCCRTLEGIRERRMQDINPIEIKMNGVQVAKIEEEQIDNTYWLVGSFSLWICLQIPAVASTLSLNHRLGSAQLPLIDPNHSAIYQLDLMSGNLSVLKSHDKNNQILYCLASTYNLIEQYLYDPVPPSPLAFESQCSHPIREVDLMISTASRFLGLKSCLAPGPSHKTIITSSHIHILLTFANKIIESSSKVSQLYRSTSSTSIIQSTTNGIHIATISTLGMVFEFLLALCLPSPFRVQSEIMEKFDLATELEVELIENNKWKILNSITSFDTILDKEFMSCSSRLSVKKQINRISQAGTETNLFNQNSSNSNHQTVMESEASASTSTGATLFSPKQQHISNHATSSNWQEQRQQEQQQAAQSQSQILFDPGDLQPPMSPYYHSLSFGEVDVSNSFQQDTGMYSSTRPTFFSESENKIQVEKRDDAFDRPWASSPSVSMFTTGTLAPSLRKRQRVESVSKDHQSGLMPPPEHSVLFNLSNQVMLYTPAEMKAMNLDPDLGSSYAFSPTRPVEGQGYYPVSWS